MPDGVELVFPDETPDEEISSAIRKLQPTPSLRAVTSLPPSPTQIRPLGEFYQTLEESRQPEFEPRFTPQELVAAGHDPRSVKQPFGVFSPFVPLPEAPRFSQRLSDIPLGAYPSLAASSLWNAVIKPTAEFVESPGGVLAGGTAALGPLAARLVAGGFTADLARHVPESAREAGRLSVEGTAQEALEAKLGLGSQIGFAGATGVGTFRPGIRSEVPVQRETLGLRPFSGAVEEAAVAGGQGPRQLGISLARWMEQPGVPELINQALREAQPQGAIHIPGQDAPALEQLAKTIYGTGIDAGLGPTLRVERPGGGAAIQKGISAGASAAAGAIPSARQVAIRPVERIQAGEPEVIQVVRQIATSGDRLTLRELRARLVANEPGLGVARANVNDYLRLIDARLVELRSATGGTDPELDVIRQTLQEQPPVPSIAVEVKPSPANQQQIGDLNAPRVRSDQGPVREEGLSVERGEEARREDIQRQQAGPTEPGAPELRKEEVSGQTTKTPIQPRGTQSVAEQAPKVPGITIPTPKGGGEAGGFVLPGPELVRTVSGFAKDAKVAGQQMLNRLRNMLHPAEFKAYEDSGLRTFLARPRTREEVAEWMQENGPRVEIITRGEAKSSLEQQKKALLEHNLDTRIPGWRQMDVEEIESKHAGVIADMYHEWQDLGDILPTPSPTHWSQISPKPESEMKDYVEGAVVVGYGTHEQQVKEGRSEPRFLSSHYFPPNTLGWFRGYMETLPNGKKVFHIIEVQSDWAQNRREFLEAEKGRRLDVRLTGVADHPLLPQWERLTLKAAIDHAIKNGADEIAVSDAETAMMTEGHDIGEHQEFLTEKDANAYAKTLDVGYKITKNADGEFVVTRIDQDAGMRLHYDKIIPQILRDLTGDKGQRVTFGEHRMASKLVSDRGGQTYAPTWAVESPGRPPANFSKKADAELYQQEHGGTISRPDLREDLIFKEPTGEPKTSITAQSYDLSRVKERGGNWSLFGSDRMKPSGGINIKLGERSEEGSFTLPDVGRAAKEVGRTLGGAIRLYSEPILERIGRVGGPVAKQVTKEASRIVAQAKGYYGSLTPTLDPAKRAVGKAYRGGTTWIRGIDNITPRAAISRTAGAIEGTITVPPNAREMVDLLKKANLDIGQLARRANVAFVPSSKMQRIISVYGVDVVRRGSGPAWDAWTKGLATANGKRLRDVQWFFRHWKRVLDQPGFDVAGVDKISQDFVRKFPKAITHIKPGLSWQEVLISDPFAYLENAAQRTAHAVAFREVYPPGTSALSATRTAVMKELATDRYSNEFDNLIRALQGHPLDSFTAAWNAPDTFPGGSVRMINQIVGMPLRALALTGNALVNFAETITGGPTIFLGYRNVVPAMARLLGQSDFYRQLEMTGDVNRAMQNKSFDPSSPVRSVMRQLSGTTRSAFLEQMFNELQEAQAAASARTVADRARAGDLSASEMERLVATMRAMGFDQRLSHSASRGNNDALLQFERRAAAFLTSGNVAMAERSRLGASRAFNELFWFHSYPQMAMNQFRSVSKNWLESASAGDWPQVRANSELLGRLIGGRTLQGAMTVGITALALEGVFGAKERKEEAKDEPAWFLANSFIAGVGGPLYILKRVIENTADASTLQKTAGSLMAPVNVGAEIMDAGLGMGRYEGRTVFERIGLFVAARTPGLRAVKNGMALFGLSQENRDLDTSIRAFYRWRRANLGFRETSVEGTPDEDKAFRAHMLRAVEALQNGQDWRPLLAEAGTRKKVSRSLLGRTLLRTPQGEHLSEEQMDVLRKHIGEKPVNLLVARDAMVRQLARELGEEGRFGEKTPIKDLSQPTGKAAIDIETGTQRHERIMSRLSPDVVTFLEKNQLKLPTYKPQFTGPQKKEVLLGPLEAAEMETEIVKRYESGVRRLMQRPDFESLRPVHKEELLKLATKGAVEAAEVKARQKRLQSQGK
jgi:hypothetical protein